MLQMVHITHRDRRIRSKATNGTHNAQGQEDKEQGYKWYT